MPFTWRQLAAIVSIMLSFVIVSNLAAFLYLEHKPINRGYGVVQAKWNLLDRTEQPVDWLILGDSSCLTAIDPVIWSRATGESVLNLCTLGDLLLLDDVWMLQAYLEKHGPPRGVLMMHVYDMWHRTLGDEMLALLGQIPRSWGVWDRYAPQLQLDGQDSWTVFMSRYLPLLSQAESIRGILAPSRGIVVRRSEKSVAKSEMNAFGFMGESADPANVVRDTARHQEFLRQNSVEISELNRQALSVLGELATKYDFPIRISMSPLHEGLAVDTHFRQYVDILNQRLSESMESVSNIDLERNFEIYPAHSMQSSDHLAAESVPDFTLKIQERISPR